ncbi:MAG: glycine--tRNA ligase subunit beta, partial [Gammaproteobacteria bacterium]|nr:glycine--tRNA ligase subunit beta [Gammaproteobacteria bacterium]
RVVEPRLKDADFFIRQDRKHPLGYYADSLDQLTFHQQLGSLADKVERIKNISLAVAQHLSVSESVGDFDSPDIELIEKSARLCKADLRTGIVCEYPELAGFIGSYYAECDGESPSICRAIRQHIKPLRSGDPLPEEKIAIVLAIADRLDTLVGIFGSGEYPSGSRDPYALRRASLALIRIVAEHRLDLDLAEWVAKSRQSYVAEIADDGIARLLDYLKERLKHYFIDCGFSSDSVDAMSVYRPLHCYDMQRRLLELRGFMQLPQSAELAAATKRIRNILKNNFSEDTREVNQSLLNNDAERMLYEAYNERSPQISALIKSKDYLEALKVLAQLREPIDNFFDKVLVMSENEDEKNNRLALLYQIDCLFMQIVDFSELCLEE